MRGGKTGLVAVGVGEGGVGVWKGACVRVGGLGQGLGCVQGQMIGLHPGLSFPQVQSVLLQRQSQGFVLGCCTTSTEGCSVGMKWWRTMTVIAS